MTPHADTDRHPVRAHDVQPIRTVILAGGKGTRLEPYTAVLPKPLLPLGDRAILEVVIHQLAEKGLTDITLSVGHLGHLIEAVFGDGAGHGVEIRFIREDAPLGTAGSFRLLGDVDDTLLVLNGDILTTLDFRDVIRHHKASGNLLTIATSQRQVKIDFGVIDVQEAGTDTPRVVGYHEKPVLERMVSMGIYVVEPQVLDYVPPSGYFDFPDLVQVMLHAKASIGAFVYNGLWLDIGRHEDYQRAVVLWEEGRFVSPDATRPPPRPVLAAGRA